MVSFVDIRYVTPKRLWHRNLVSLISSLNSDAEDVRSSCSAYQPIRNKMNLPPGLRPRSRAALSDVEETRSTRSLATTPTSYRQSSLVMNNSSSSSNSHRPHRAVTCPTVTGPRPHWGWHLGEANQDRSAPCSSARFTPSPSRRVRAKKVSALVLSAAGIPPRATWEYLSRLFFRMAKLRIKAP